MRIVGFGVDFTYFLWNLRLVQIDGYEKAYKERQTAMRSDGIAVED